MGILSFIKGQFIEIIEWLDNPNYTLVYRFPDDDHEIKNGAKLVCRENQAAILINEGQLADVFGPATHTLSTQNLPILSRLKGWKYGWHPRPGKSRRPNGCATASSARNWAPRRPPVPTAGTSTPSMPSATT